MYGAREVWRRGATSFLSSDFCSTPGATELLVRLIGLPVKTCPLRFRYTSLTGEDTSCGKPFVDPQIRLMPVAITTLKIECERVNERDWKCPLQW